MLNNNTTSTENPGIFCDESNGIAALLYAAQRRWHVFPVYEPRGGGCSCLNPSCDRIGKHPRTAHGVCDATTDEDTIRKWWNREPDANVAVATGVKSGIIVLDVDPCHGGNESLAALETSNGTLPDTVECLTGGGGRHLYFEHPGVPISNRIGIAPGLDIRGDGGYVIAPPSQHESHRRYEWELCHHPDVLPLAPPPLWLLNLIRKPTQSSDCAADMPLTKGNRNSTLFKLACAMRRHNAPFEAIHTALNITNQQRCSPPLPDAEVERIATSAMRYAPRWHPDGHVEPKRERREILLRDYIKTSKRRVETYE